MSRYRRIAAIVARRSFAPAGALGSQAGAELRVLVEELGETADTEWLLEEGRSDRRLEKLREAIEWVIESYATRQMVPPLERTGAVTFFRFVVRDDPDEADEVRHLRGRLRLHDQMLAVLRALDPSHFERLCGRVLIEIGCDAVHVTRSSQDLGSDFFGRSPTAVAETLPTLGVPTRLRVLANVYMLLFGQAKRHADYNKVNLDTIKLVEGTWGDIVRRKLNGVLPQHLDDGLAAIGWQAGDVVKLMFITTSSYTSAARDWATNAGMATLDGDQLAQLLLEAEVGVERDDDQNGWRTSTELVTAACVV
jgi:Restriction endonuclease